MIVLDSPLCRIRRHAGVPQLLKACARRQVPVQWGVVGRSWRRNSGLGTRWRYRKAHIMGASRSWRILHAIAESWTGLRALSLTVGQCEGFGTAG